jgi:hypothetical protein
MTLLDDDIDDLLRAFRADEALLDDDIRTRMWARITEAAPAARAELDALVPPAEVRRLPRRFGPRNNRVLAVAAAVLVLLAVAGVGLRLGPGGNDPTTAGPVTEPVRLVSLQDLADTVKDRPVTVLGSSPDTRYAYLSVERSFRGSRDDLPIDRIEEQWIDLDGTGRIRVSGQAGRDDEVTEPGSLPLGMLRPDVAVGLPDDVGAVDAALLAAGAVDTGPGVSAPVLATLAAPGLPGPARAGLIRFLDGLGFHPVTATGLGPNLARVEGPGPDGSTLRADFDLRTGKVVMTSLMNRRGLLDLRIYTEVDLRPDTLSR